MHKSGGVAVAEKSETENASTIDTDDLLSQFSGDNINQDPEYQLVIGKGVGAKPKNYDVMDLSTREIYHFAEGTHLQNVEVFAGKNSTSIFRKANKYANKLGGDPDKWQHVKGIGLLETPDGYRAAEVHWVQCQGIGKFDFFIKEWLE